MDNIKLILFDFDKTLTKGPREGYIPAFKLKNKFGLTDDQISSISRADKQLKPKYFDARVSLHINTREKETKLHYSLYEKMLKEMQIDNHKVIANFMVDYRMNQLRHELKDSIIDLLKNLRKRYRLAIFTNALPSREKEIKDIGLNVYFDDIYISNLLKSYKPQAKFFDFPATKFGLDYAEMLLIDDKESLVQRVNKLGVRTILVDQKKDLKEQLYKELKL